MVVEETRSKKKKNKCKYEACKVGHVGKKLSTTCCIADASGGSAYT